MSYWCKYNEGHSDAEHDCEEVMYVDDSEDSVYEEDSEWVSVVPIEGSE